MRNRHFDYRQECMVGSPEDVRSVVFFSLVVAGASSMAFGLGLYMGPAGPSLR